MRLRHFLGFQTRDIGRVGSFDVPLQPVFEELEHLNRHGRPSGIELGLKCEHLFGQRIMFRLVRGEYG